MIVKLVKYGIENGQEMVEIGLKRSNFDRFVKNWSQSLNNWSKLT